ncbi:MAG: DUF5916 domain-containing protein [Pseudomonadales bacterium]|nr:DUF5916 domain-containing protein [Pseudomonadales bacterium]
MNSKRTFLPVAGIFVFMFVFMATAHAQETVPALTKVADDSAAIRLDGILDEAVWQRVPAIDGMRVINPDTLVPAAYQTEVRIFYTERGIYAGFMNHQPADSLIARMTSRDTRLERDGVVFNIDPSGEGLYGYMMRINLGGSKTDATILPERQLNLQWDGSWDAETAVVEGGWSAEYFIPWSMVALPQPSGDVQRMGIYLERQVGALNETWSFPPLPNTVNEFLSAYYMMELEAIEPRTQITYYPFVSNTYDGIRNETEQQTGIEIFWRPTSNTQISASLNPDFGNVESDDVVVNLTAFEVFFPEKRSFFLEGQDVFNTTPRSQGANGPGGPTTLLNTRRIGRAPSFKIPAGVSARATDISQQTELLGALKFTGQSGNWRYGTMLALEDDTAIRGTFADGTPIKLEAEGRDFFIARLLYEDTANGGRRSIGWMGTTISHPDIEATVNGIDLHYFSADTRWVMDAQLVHSDVDGETGSGIFGDIVFRPARGRQHRVSLTYLDDTLDLNDLGFLTRNDLVQMDYNFSLTESDIEGLRSRTTSFQLINQWNTSGQPVRLGLFANRNYTFLNNNSLNTSIRYFNPRIDDRLGRGTGEFRIPERWQAVVGWSSDPSQKLVYSTELNASQEDLGQKLLTTSAGINYRPVDNFSLGIDVAYTDREGLLQFMGSNRFTSFEANQWSPRVTMDYFINADQQLRFSLQWTGLKAHEDKFFLMDPDRLDFLEEVAKPGLVSDSFTISQLTFQARYRWEIAPLSDLFVVYTRGGNLPRNTDDSFSGLLSDAFTDPIVETLVVKLRYRFGS